MMLVVKIISREETQRAVSPSVFVKPAFQWMNRVVDGLHLRQKRLDGDLGRRTGLDFRFQLLCQALEPKDVLIAPGPISNRPLYLGQLAAATVQPDHGGISAG
jgi:hypothetical protein